MTIKIYVEGGGDSKALRTACRKGFREFIENAGISCREIGIGVIACGGRNNAFDSFKTALTTDDSPILLVDSEEPVKAPVTAAKPWEHLEARDGWVRPPGARDEQCHLMVEVMESWFLADTATLIAFFARSFQEKALPGNSQVEQVGKTDILDGLVNATQETQKGRYGKGSHSFEILARLDPGSVEGAAPYAKRFLDTLRAGGPT